MSAPIKGVARIDSSGKVYQLGPKATADEVVTPDDVKDPIKLAKLAARILASIAQLRRNWVPRRFDYEDLPIDGSGGVTQLQHNFGGRVRWWVVEWAASSTTSGPIIKQTAATDANTLVLAGYLAGTATIRVEEAG